jgi:galactokinase
MAAERRLNTVARAEALYRATFGAGPARVASAPGRVNLIGEHVDYHGGHVLPVAIAERTAVAVGSLPGRFAAVSEQEAAVHGAWPAERAGRWSDYVAGVARLLTTESGAKADGLAVAVASDVPLGAGVSSSAALEVASAAALASWWDLGAGPRDIAAVAHRAETEFVGVPCGVMDQLASAMAPEGSALLINCATLEARPVPVAADLVLVDSGESHELRAGAYAERRREGEEALTRVRSAAPDLKDLKFLAELPPRRLGDVLKVLPPPLDRRVRHVVEENQRVLKATETLVAGQFRAFGKLVDASHDSLRDLYECSTPRLDAIVAAARETPGVLGARLVGAGWGGSVLVVAVPGRGDDVARRLADGASVGPGAARRVKIGYAATVNR